MQIDSDRSSLWDDIFAPEAEGVRVVPGPAVGQLTISYVEDHYIHSIIDEGGTYFDFVRRNALLCFQEQVSRLEQKLAELKEQNALLNQQLFGTSSEKSVGTSEIPPATEPDVGTGDAQVIELPKERKSNSAAGRKPLPDHLPREEQIHKASCCPCCQSNKLHEISVEATEQLAIIPARLKVIRHLRKKYSCRHCFTVFTAEGVKHLIEKSSYASPDLLAHIACSKYQFGLPFYRQEAIFEQAGHLISRTTLANLMNGCGDKLSAVWETLRQELLQQGVIHADETRIQVLKEPGRKAQTQSWLWLYCSREGAPRQVTLFDYQQTRAGYHPRQFLEIDGERPFVGHLQTDAYVGYDDYPGVTRGGCMSHVRRKFTDVIKVLPSQASNSPARYAVELIGKLYGIERRIKGLPDRIRYKVRQEESVPILAELKEWLDDMQPKVTPGGKLGKAIEYALNQWSAVRCYVDDGRWAIDNNIAERKIKSVVIGRKNWLFADSPEGAHTIAVMYSLVETAKANGLNPFDYLKYVIETMPKLRTADEVRSLLPWNMPRIAETADQMAA